MICQGKKSYEIDTPVYDHEWNRPHFPPTAMETVLPVAVEIQLGNKEVPNLTSSQKKILNSAILEFQDVIAWTEEDIGQTFVKAQPSDTGDTPPNRGRGCTRH